MSRYKKLLDRFLSKPNDFTFKELTTLLYSLNFYLDNKGKTSGSAVIFINKEYNIRIKMHKPHGSKPLLRYQIDKVIKQIERII